MARLHDQLQAAEAVVEAAASAGHAGCVHLLLRASASRSPSRMRASLLHGVDAVRICTVPATAGHQREDLALAFTSVLDGQTEKVNNFFMERIEEGVILLSALQQYVEQIVRAPPASTVRGLHPLATLAHHLYALAPRVFRTDTYCARTAPAAKLRMRPSRDADGLPALACDAPLPAPAASELCGSQLHGAHQDPQKGTARSHHRRRRVASAAATLPPRRRRLERERLMSDSLTRLRYAFLPVRKEVWRGDQKRLH